MAKAKLCASCDCGNPVVARGMCGKHYQKWRKTAPDEEVRIVAAAGAPLAWIIANATHGGDECLIWPFGRYSTGYGALNLPEGGSVMSSRRMCEVAHGDAPTPEHQAAHSCGNGKNGCMNPKHLYWADRSTNEGDKVDHGTSNRGERNGHAKVTEEMVREIRGSSEGPSALARRLGVSPPTICDIRTRRSWAWLD